MSIKYLLVLVLLLVSTLAVLSVDVQQNNEVNVENLEKKKKSYCYSISHSACLLHEETDGCCAWYGNVCHPTGACTTTL